MNEPLPPVDGELRRQLLRRASSRVPADLESSIERALDALPADRRSPIAGRRFAFRMPRTLAAGAAIGAAALLVAAAFAVPLLRPSPASGPSANAPVRPLTAAELARFSTTSLPIGQYPAVVADVTIQPIENGCPMDRYPTVGVVANVDTQICVMGSSVAALLPDSTSSVSGIFAFRYLASGWLGLIGKITPQDPSRLAFRVADDWPQQGQFFLVQGWLGRQAVPVSCPTVLSPGDILSPDSQGCPEDSWLSDDPTASGIAGKAQIGGGGPTDLFGNTRYVQADAARYFDSIDSSGPVWGTYVVRAVLEPCAGEPATSSRGCAVWRVQAKVTDPQISRETSAPSPSAAPTPTAPPPATPVAPDSPVGLAGPDGRPLTIAEFVAAYNADPSHLGGRIVITKGPLPEQMSCIGPVLGGEPCPAAPSATLVAPEGYWAVRVGYDGHLLPIGVLSMPNGGFTVKALELPDTEGFYVVDGWLWYDGLRCDVPLPTNNPPCSPSWLSDSTDSQTVFVGPYSYATFGTGDAKPVHAFWLVRVWPDNLIQILARLTTP